MAIAFSYTETTNIVVVTGGTYGTPATFADFVTADRAGVDTILLSAGSPASNLALTYAVRPVEDLAILVKCVVASKTPAQTDYIFITGKDWRGAAQTESIDVTAGNGSYTSTKYWSEITTLDCSDNAAGGGVVWADGDLSVTQDVWGVIWDYGGGQYKIDAVFDIGDDVIETHFTEINCQVVFSNLFYFVPHALSYVTFGEKVDNQAAKNGCHIILIQNNVESSLYTVGGNFNLYDTIWQQIGTTLGHSCKIFKLSGTHEIIQTTIQHKNRLEFAGVFSNVYNCFIYNVWNGFRLYNGVTVKKLILKDAAEFGYEMGMFSGGTAVLEDSEFEASPELRVQSGSKLYLIDTPISTPTLNMNNANDRLYEQYTCNVHIADKDGTNLQNVTVLCEDKDGTEVFSVSTDASGDIAEQTITYKGWAGADETLTTYSPHKFTISKAGYETMVLDAVTVDEKINWKLELQPSGSQRPRIRMHGA